jgi:hypothetical protein
MPQPLQPLPQLQELPQPHFPEQHDIFGSVRAWDWMTGGGDGGFDWLLAACWLEELW